MKAIVCDQPGLPIADPRALYETELPKPEAGPHDLLVKIRAIAVNPVDAKVRAGLLGDTPLLLGWDAVGTVEAVGDAVTLFKVGDGVFYAGSVTRPGAYAEYAVVDERIAGHRPTTLGEHFGAINAENLRRAHALIESDRTCGKIVLEAF